MEEPWDVASRRLVTCGMFNGEDCGAEVGAGMRTECGGRSGGNIVVEFELVAGKLCRLSIPGRMLLPKVCRFRLEFVTVGPSAVDGVDVPPSKEGLNWPKASFDPECSGIEA